MRGGEMLKFRFDRCISINNWTSNIIWGTLCIFFSAGRLPRFDPTAYPFFCEPEYYWFFKMYDHLFGIFKLLYLYMWAQYIKFMCMWTADWVCDPFRPDIFRPFHLSSAKTREDHALQMSFNSWTEFVLSLFRLIKCLAPPQAKWTYYSRDRR